jgi:hypothetical protein
MGGSVTISPLPVPYLKIGENLNPVNLVFPRHDWGGADWYPWVWVILPNWIGLILCGLIWIGFWISKLYLFKNINIIKNTIK